MDGENLEHSSLVSLSAGHAILYRIRTQAWLRLFEEVGNAGFRSLREDDIV